MNHINRNRNQAFGHNQIFLMLAHLWRVKYWLLDTGYYWMLARPPKAGKILDKLGLFQ
jgi:hypothetical protein